LVDQPLINAAYYDLLIAQFLTFKERITASNLAHKPSVPAIFDAYFFDKLTQLNEDKDAKYILKSVINNIFILNSNVNLIDVDTIESYENTYKSFGKGL